VNFCLIDGILTNIDWNIVNILVFFKWLFLREKSSAFAEMVTLSRRHFHAEN